MKKLFLFALCIALVTCLFVACGGGNDADSSTGDTNQSTDGTSGTTAPATTPSTTTGDHVDPSMDLIPSTPSQDSTQPATVAPNGGVEDGNGGNNGAGGTNGVTGNGGTSSTQRSMGGRG